MNNKDIIYVNQVENIKIDSSRYQSKFDLVSLDLSLNSSTNNYKSS